MKEHIGLGFLLTFIIGILLSVITYIIVHDLEEAKTKSLFEFGAKSHQSALDIAILNHQKVINSTSALFSSSKNVTRKEFKNYVKEIIKDHPQIKGISWNPLMNNTQLKRYTQNAKIDGISTFSITKINSEGKRVLSEKKKSYIPVYYIEPYAKNKLALGLDISSNQQRMQTINQAIDTANTVATPRIKLVQENGNYYGYLLIKAIYKENSPSDTIKSRRENFIGLVVGVFSFENFISTRLEKLNPFGLDVWLLDVSSPKDEQFLDFHQSKSRNIPLIANKENLELAKQGLYWESTIHTLGRKWLLLFSPSPTFIQNNYPWNSIILSSIILLIVFLILLHMYTKARDNSKRTDILEHKVKQRTKELQKHQDDLEIIVEQEVEKNKQQTAYIVQQSRLAQMGEMISMIAHQWRQPLSVISALAIHLQIELDLKDIENKKIRQELLPYFSESLTKINSTVQELSTTINDFRDFYKPNKEQTSIQLDELVRKVLRMLHSSLIRANIEVVESYSSNIELEVYENEMIHVILNILKNAKDNFKEKKVQYPSIKITTTDEIISISDNGGGIDKNIIQKIFDPYFSTKDDKNGTGLGLYMSRSIIHDHHNGKLIAENINDGVCFTITLNSI